MIEAAGFGDVEIGERVDVFAGASGEGNARAFETHGYTFRAVEVREFDAPLDPATCAIPG